MEGKNRDVIRGPVPEFDQDVMKNATNNFRQISVPLASFAPILSPKWSWTVTSSATTFRQNGTSKWQVTLYSMCYICRIKRFVYLCVCFRRSWPLMCSAARLLGWRVRIPLRAKMLVSCVCSVLCRKQPLRWADHSFRGVLPGVCNIETSTMRRHNTDLARCATEEHRLALTRFKCQYFTCWLFLLVYFSLDTCASNAGSLYKCL
jgi:hypothetical protein